MAPLLSSSHSSQVRYKKYRPQHQIENVNPSCVSTLVKPNRCKAKSLPSTEDPEAKKMQERGAQPDLRSETSLQCKAERPSAQQVRKKHDTKIVSKPSRIGALFVNLRTPSRVASTQQIKRKPFSVITLRRPRPHGYFMPSGPRDPW